jgi:L-malate glycosyltransferase
MKSKKIFFIANTHSIHTAKWVNYFVDKKYDVYIATFASENKTKCKKIFFLTDENFNVKGGNYHYLFFIGKLAKLFKNIKPDIINAHYSYSMGFISLLAYKKSKIQADFSVVCPGSGVLAPPIPIVFDLVNKYVFKNSHKIFAVSDQIKDKLSNSGVEINKIFTGQYGIEINRQNEQPTKNIDILSNRNYTPNSRIEFLLESLSVFEDKGLNIVFVLPHIDDDKLKYFKMQFPFINFYNRVTHKEMIDIVSRSKIYISATESDGTSLSLLEAMGQGAVPVVSNIVSNRSWILDTINGYLFDTKEQFINSLNDLIDKNASEMININKHLIMKKCTYEKQMHKIEEFLLR